MLVPILQEVNVYFLEEKNVDFFLCILLEGMLPLSLFLFSVSFWSSVLLIVVCGCGCGCGYIIFCPRWELGVCLAGWMERTRISCCPAPSAMFHSGSVLCLTCIVFVEIHEEIQCV